MKKFLYVVYRLSFFALGAGVAIAALSGEWSKAAVFLLLLIAMELDGIHETIRSTKGPAA